jgi:hypothetical protein
VPAGAAPGKGYGYHGLTLQDFSNFRNVST